MYPSMLLFRRVDKQTHTLNVQTYAHTHRERERERERERASKREREREHLSQTDILHANIPQLYALRLSR